MIGLAVDYPAGTRIRPHRHRRHQFLYAGSGVMRVGVPRGQWIVPPLRAVWIPAETEHSVSTKRRLQMRTLYLHADGSHDVPTDCRVLDVTPLLRELVFRAVEHGEISRSDPRHLRLAEMILDEIVELPAAPLLLPEPSDERLRRITSALRREPANDRSLAAWAEVVGASVRTLARHFVAETGLTFVQWRRQARLVLALELLAGGHSVKAVAIETGYSSASAFVTTFRKALGTTPGRYFAEDVSTGTPGR